MAFFLGCSTLGLRFRAPRRRIISLRMAVGSSLRRFHLLAAVLSGGGFIFARMYPRGRLSGPAGFSAGGVSFRPFDGLLIRGGIFCSYNPVDAPFSAGLGCRHHLARQVFIISYPNG